MSKYIFGLGEYGDFRKFVNFLEESNVLNESVFENTDKIELYKDWIAYKANNKNATYIDFLEWKRSTNRKMSREQKSILSDWNKTSKRDAYTFLQKNTDKSLEKKEAELYFGKSFDRLNSRELRKYRAWLKVKDRGRGVTLDEYIGSDDGSNVRDVFGKRYKDLDTKQRNLYTYWINAKKKGDKRSLQDFVDEYEPHKGSPVQQVFGKTAIELN